MNKMTNLSFKSNSSSNPNAFLNQSTTDTNQNDNFYYWDEDNTFENAKYSVFEIANWFLSKESMTHKKIQKLCYYAQAWCYTLKDYKLMDTNFEAWIHGPVSPVLYDKFKVFGFNSIRLAGEYNGRIESQDQELLESVWETYGDHTGNALEALSHSEPPWIEARAGYSVEERCNVPISVEAMKKYYSAIYLGGDV